ncbi:MAG TPA: ATP-dependent metallopeptidase FtsH/Yme1/Tma family protein, partial [Candidatus Bathyarchaeia archaeon]|nr:ATP-dependent metallopeptidase FtsH/Yme1/Tma family protein [Candidatus Bathyarchaeia archaeon]
MNRFFRNTGFYLLIFLVTVGIVNFVLSGTDKVDEISYQEFRVQLKANNISEVMLRPAGGTYRVEGKLVTVPAGKQQSFTTNVPLSSTDIIGMLDQKIDTNQVKKVEYKEAEGNNIWLTFITS